MRELLTRFFDLFRRDKLDGELKDELIFHQQMLERDARATGAPTGEQVYAARRRLGNITGVRERARDAWSFAWLETVTQDLRYAFRGLRRSPGFTAAVVITLGLGVGASSPGRCFRTPPGSLSDDLHLMYYLPFDQKTADGGTGARMLIRMSGRDAPRHEDEVRRALQSVMPGESYIMVWPLQDEVDGQQRSWQSSVRRCSSASACWRSSSRRSGCTA